MIYVAHIKDKNERNEIQTLVSHLLGVSKLTGLLANKIGFKNTGELLGLLHDLGKYSKSFQNYIKSGEGFINQDEDDYVDASGLKGKIDHSTAGAQYIWNIIEEKYPQKKAYAQLLSLCLVSHHSGLIDCISPDGENKFIDRINKDFELTRYYEVLNNIDKEITERVEKLIDESIKEVETIFKIIFKNWDGNKTLANFGIAMLARMLFSCLIDADRLDTADFDNPEKARNRLYGRYISWDMLIERFKNSLKKISIPNQAQKINQIRQAISDECYNKASCEQAIYTLTVPTGGGKTLSSLRFALYHAKKHNLDRIIYVIPYTTIIEQNAQVAREILETAEESQKIVLEHHSNLLPKNYTWKNKVLAENWDAPIVFTTMVQFLEALLSGGTQRVRRMHQLAKSVIIFDEIQTLPVKTVHLFNNAINFLVNYCKSTIVLCTATQPLLNEVDNKKGSLNLKPENELAPDIKQIYKELKRVNVKNSIRQNGLNSDDIADFAIEQIQKTGSCLIIVNTKRMARLIYESLINSNYPVFHLSTAMCSAHRKNKFDQIKNHLLKQEPVICVSTQLIEAGVDIDFGTVIRSVAGIDSIAQAAGRCNRNGQREIGEVFIINPNEEKIEGLTDIKIGKEKTERILREISKGELSNDDFLGPEIIEHYFRYYFFERAYEMDYRVTQPREDSLLNMLSNNSLAFNEYLRIHGNSSTNIFLRQSFKSAFESFAAIDAPTRGIVVPYSEGKEIINGLFSGFAMEKKGELLRKAQRYSVSVFSNQLKKLIDSKAIREAPDVGVFTLSDERYYHNEFGLDTECLGTYSSLII